MSWLKIQFIATVLLLITGASHARENTAEDCIKSFADIMDRGKDSETFIWRPEVLTKNLRGTAPSGAPLDSPEIGSLYRSKPFEFDANPVSPQVRMTSEEFRKRFPHDINNLAQSQSTVRLAGGDYLVESFDSATGTVTLFREDGMLRQASPKISSQHLPTTHVGTLTESQTPSIYHYGENFIDLKNSNSTHMRTFKWKSGYSERYKEERNIPITLSKDLYLEEFEEPISAMKPGMVIAKKSDKTNRPGLKYEVRSVDEHGQGRVYLRRTERLSMSLSDFVRIVGDGTDRLVHSPPELTESIANSSRRPWWNIRSAPQKDIELVGKRFKREPAKLSTSNDFESSKAEMNPAVVVDELVGGKYPGGTKIEIKWRDYGQDRSTEYVVGDSRWDSNKSALRRWVSARDFDGSPDEKFDSIVVTSPQSNRPLVLAADYVKTRHGETVRKFFDVSPVETVDLTYKVRAKDGMVPVSVRFPKPKNLIERMRLTRIADQLIANLPVAHADAQGVILLEGGEYFLKDAAGLAHHKGIDGARTISMMNDQIGKSLIYRLGVFWHETGHSIAMKLWNSQFVPSGEWQRAVALDGKFVSGYATHGTRKDRMIDLVEDFPETVQAYIATDGGRLEPELRKHFAARFAMLDRVFQNPASAEIRVMLAAAQAKHRIGVVPIALGAAGSGAGAAVFYFSQGSEK